jgi:serine/threonine-protein phosphatase PGAM5
VAIATSNFCKSSNDDDRNISALTLSMYLDDYILEYKEWEKENKFKLVKESHSYICEAPSREEYKLWLQALDSSKPIEQEHHEYVISSRMIGKSSSLCNSFLYSMPPKTMHIILVRHGHYINAHARHIQDAEQILTQLGRQQANVTGKYLEQLYSRSPTREEITIYHSDMSRAVETASIMSKVFGHCSLSKTSLLREGYPGRPFSIENHRQVIGPAIDTKELERMELAYQTFFSQNEEEPDDRFRVVVCHANLIRFFLCRAMKIDPVGMWGHFEINHCGVTRINICENRPIKVISVNETGHLPHTLITSSEDHL